MPTAICDGIPTRYELLGSGPPLLMFSPGGHLVRTLRLPPSFPKTPGFGRRFSKPGAERGVDVFMMWMRLWSR